MEVLDSVAHSVRVKPENLRLAEVRGLQLASKPWAALVGAPGSPTESVAVSSPFSTGGFCPRVAVSRAGCCQADPCSAGQGHSSGASGATLVGW